MFRPIESLAAIFARHSDERAELVEKAYSSRKVQIARIRALLDGQERALQKAFLASVNDVKSAVSLARLANLIENGDIARAVDELDDEVSKYFQRFTQARTNAFIKAGVEEAAEISDSLPRIFVQFNQVNEGAVNAMRANELRLIREISDNQRLTIRQALLGSVSEGINPRQAARDVRGALGLTERQEQAVRNYRRALRDGNSSALQRALRDRRFDGTVARAVRGEKNLTSDQIDDLTNRYRNRYLMHRAEVVARTESLRAVHEGANEMWEQAADSGQIKTEEVRRYWVTAKDMRVRDAHRAVPRLNVKGRRVGEPFLTPLGPLMYPGDPGGVPENTIQCRCVVITRVVPESQRADTDGGAAQVGAGDVLSAPTVPRFTHIDVIDEGLRAGFRSEDDFSTFLTDLGIVYNPQTLPREIASRIAALRRIETRTGRKILRPERDYAGQFATDKPKPAPRKKPATARQKELAYLKTRWNKIMENSDNAPRLIPVWNTLSDKGKSADLDLMRAVVARGDDDGKRLGVTKNPKDRQYAFSARDRAIYTKDDPDLGYPESDSPSLRHEFFHYLDSAGMDDFSGHGNYASTSAARQLRRDHDLHIAGGDTNPDAGVKELYQHLKIDYSAADPDDLAFFFSEHLASKFPTPDARLAALRKYEVAMGRYLKAKKIKFDLNAMMEHVSHRSLEERALKSFDITLALVRGDRFAVMDDIDDTMKFTASLDRANGKVNREVLYLRDYFGALTNEKVGEGHGQRYYGAGQRLFSTKIGDIHDKNLAEGFANYFEMRYNTAHAYRHQLAQILFPETSARFDEILKEIGAGKHAYNDSVNYVDEARAAIILSDADDVADDDLARFAATGLEKDDDGAWVWYGQNEYDPSTRAKFNRVYSFIEDDSDAGIMIRAYTSSPVESDVQDYFVARAVGDKDEMNIHARAYARFHKSDDLNLIERHAKALIEASKTRTNLDVTMYRHAILGDEDLYNSVMEGVRKNAVIKYDRIMSFTHDQEFAVDGIDGFDDVPRILYEIEVPEGSRGWIGITDDLSNHEEFEAFSVPGTKFRVLDVRENVTLPDIGAEGVTVIRLRALDADDDVLAAPAAKPATSVSPRDFSKPETLPAPTKVSMLPNARAMVELGMRSPDDFVAYLVHHNIKHTDANARRDFKATVRRHDSTTKPAPKPKTKPAPKPAADYTVPSYVNIKGPKDIKAQFDEFGVNHEELVVRVLGINKVDYREITDQENVDVIIIKRPGYGDYELKVKTDDGRLIIQRLINLDKGKATHALLVLPEKYQGQDIGKKIMLEAIEAYKEMGINQIFLDAGMNVGKYVWARYGFTPHNWESASKGIHNMLTQKGGLGESISKDALKDILEILDDPSPKAIWRLAEYDKYTHAETGQPLGKAIMLKMYSGWAGKLRLSDKAAMKKFYDYANRAKKK